MFSRLGELLKKGDFKKDPQTAKVGWLQQEFAEHPTRGLTPAKLARILQAAEHGDLMAQCDLAEDIEEKDAHVFAEMAKRKRALLSLRWDINSPRNATAAEQKQAEQIAEWCGDLPMDDLILDLSDAIHKGFSCVEIQWQRMGKIWLPSTLSHRESRWFTVPQSNRNELRLRDNSLDGEPLRPLNWLVHCHKAKSGYLTRSGLCRVLAWPFLFKNYSVRDLAEFIEIYGLPLRLGKYPNGATDAEKATLLRAVLSIGHHAGGIMPQGMEIEFHDAAKGEADTYQLMIDWCERSQSKAILGATLTSQTDSGSGAYALGSVHNDVRLDLRDGDAVQIAKTINRDLIAPLCLLNFGVNESRRCPRFAFDTQQAADLAMYAEALPKLVDVGVPIGAHYVRDKLRIPAAEKDEPLLQRLSPAAVEPENALAALRGAAPAPDTVEQLANDMATDWERVASPLMQPIFDLRDSVDSYDQLIAALPELLKQMDDAALAELLAQGNFAATLYGRLDEPQ